MPTNEFENAFWKMVIICLVRGVLIMSDYIAKSESDDYCNKITAISVMNHQSRTRALKTVL